MVFLSSRLKIRQTAETVGHNVQLFPLYLITD
ncbi:hypothetical protein LYNGBM3L_62670 [Moorena producens 3L]|uniref:Uncharacterized protein n=1 Tax=Moorena producens 3L TaxID=489825 RepID=F4Y0T5_9CYAN|nr:hypothetical protein LYNGBM3L_62670 [Moorena producens 3L]